MSESGAIPEPGRRPQPHPAASRIAPEAARRTGNRDRRVPLECLVPFKEREFSVRGLRLDVRAVAAAMALAAAVPLLAEPSVPPGKTVVLGFDGADHKVVTRMLAEGKLPNLSKLAASGGFRPLLPTIPAQTPVSWSTFSTGISRPRA